MDEFDAGARQHGDKTEGCVGSLGDGYQDISDVLDEPSCYREGYWQQEQGTQKENDGAETKHRSSHRNGYETGEERIARYPAEVIGNERKGSYLRRGGNTQHAPSPAPYPMLRLIQLAEQGIKQENAAHGKKRHLKTDTENGQGTEYHH